MTKGWFVIYITACVRINSDIICSMLCYSRTGICKTSKCTNAYKLASKFSENKSGLLQSYTRIQHSSNWTRNLSYSSEDARQHESIESCQFGNQSTTCDNNTFWIEYANLTPPYWAGGKTPGRGASGASCYVWKKSSFLMFSTAPTRQNPGYATESCS